MSNTLKFIKFRNSATVPTKAHPEDAGYDVFMNKEFTTVDNKNCIITFNTGIGIIPPTGYYFILVERSSCYKSPFQLVNKIGIIDQNYRGEIKAVMRYKPVKTLDCTSLPDFVDTLRILQLIPVKCAPNFDVVVSNTVEAEEQTVRGDGGFGSTGVGSDNTSNVTPGLEVKDNTTILTLPDGSTYAPTKLEVNNTYVPTKVNYTCEYLVDGKMRVCSGKVDITPALISEVQVDPNNRTPSISSRGIFL